MSLQFITYLLPFITLPYLIRVVGVEKYGVIAFALSISQYFLVISDFGFNLSATKSISQHRDDSNKINEIFSSVIIIKTFIVILSLFILIISTIIIHKLNDNLWVYLFTYGMVIGQSVFPVWFYMGIEKMKYITIINLIGRSFFTLLIFLFVKDNDDYIYVPIINSFGYILIGVLGFIIAIKNFNVKIYVVEFRVIIKYLKESFSFFLSRASVSIYTSSNTFILGLFTNDKIVGYYAMIEKLYMAITQLYQPIVQVLYPFISKTRDTFFFKKVLKYVLFVNFFSVFFAFLFSSELISLVYGFCVFEVDVLFKIFLLIGLAVVPSTMLGYPLLAAMGYQKYANNSVIYGGVIYFFIILLLVSFSKVNIYAIGVGVLVTELYILFYRFFYSKRFNLLK